MSTAEHKGWHVTLTNGETSLMPYRWCFVTQAGALGFSDEQDTAHSAVSGKPVGKMMHLFASGTWQEVSRA